MKVGVLVVAYNAETTLRWVLDRIPSPLRSELVEVLVMDDHSGDATFDVAHEYIADGADIPLTIVRHEANLGYGGNQKAGYRYAIDHGWDIVVLLHGDGQYAPEMMPDLLAPFADDGVDAVFGSRMLDPGGARRGGMPLYKYVGNRILTRIQNVIAGVRLSEWHSGYRAYRVSALADLPFVGNSDGFDFDTEIILQLLGAGTAHRRGADPHVLRRRDLPRQRHRLRPRHRARHGPPSPRARSASAAATSGTRTSPTRTSRRRTARTASCSNSFRTTFRLRVLDVGCGPGWVAAELRRRGHHVTGVDLLADEGVTERTDRFFEADLEHGLPDEVGGGFDVVIAADVIEHVRNPDVLLGRSRRPDVADGDDRRQRSELRPLVPARPDRGWVCSTTTSAASSTAPTSASSPGGASAGRSPTRAWSRRPSATPGCHWTSSGWRAARARSSRSSIACCVPCGRRCSRTSSS